MTRGARGCWLGIQELVVKRHDQATPARSWGWPVVSEWPATAPQLLGSGQERQTVQGMAVWRQDWPRRVKLCLQEAANFPTSSSRSSNGHPETRLRSLLSFNFNALINDARSRRARVRCLRREGGFIKGSNKRARAVGRWAACAGHFNSGRSVSQLPWALNEGEGERGPQGRQADRGSWWAWAWAVVVGLAARERGRAESGRGRGNGRVGDKRPSFTRPLAHPHPRCSWV